MFLDGLRVSRQPSLIIIKVELVAGTSVSLTSWCFFNANGWLSIWITCMSISILIRDWNLHHLKGIPYWVNVEWGMWHATTWWRLKMHWTFFSYIVLIYFLVFLHNPLLWRYTLVTNYMLIFYFSIFGWQ